MVRQLAIDFLYKKSGNSLVPESNPLTMALAFTYAISREKEGMRLKKFSRISLPFWMVQVSPQKSVLLSASSSKSFDFTFAYETRLSEVRRLISNEVSEPNDVPDVVERALGLMDELETTTMIIRNLCGPEAISEVGQYVSELEPSYTPNRIEQTFSSQHALAESEAFQKIRDDLLARVERMDEMKTLVSDQLRGHLKVLENLVSMEKRKWDARIHAMESNTAIATHDLELKKSDELYTLKDKFRKMLRAKTVEFARASIDIERYFTSLLEHVQETRVTIAQNKDDLEGAVEEYQNLAKYLSDALPRFQEILHALNEKSVEVLEDAMEYKETLVSGTDETEASVDSEIDQKKQRLAELEQERQEKETELKELLNQVVSAIDRLEGRIKKRQLEYQAEVLNLQRITIGNDSVHNIAPLTHLDIFFFVGEYTDGNCVIFPPILSPEDRFNLPASYQPLSITLETFMQDTIQHNQDADSSFKSRYDSAIYEGNLFDDPDTLDTIELGLKDLQFRQLLGEGMYERILRSVKRCLNE